MVIIPPGKRILWVFTLFAANEIPSVVVTFVALLIFLQMDVGMSTSTLYAAILLLPWALQPLMRRFLPTTGRRGAYRWRLLGTECAIAVVMALFALFMGHHPQATLIVLLCISTLSSWHSLLAHVYYLGRTSATFGRAPRIVRALSSQITTVLTYGLMIMAVGVLEIYFRQKAMWYSWSLCLYILAGVYILTMLVNAAVLLTNSHTLPLPPATHFRQRQWRREVAMLVFLLVPQGLMFFSRTIFLLARPSDGGLGCTLQEVGFAQGTIGAIAFLLGIAVGQGMQREWQGATMQRCLTMCLGLSPVVYLAMTQWPPESLWTLSLHTFAAQLLFGMGLCGCGHRIEHISGQRYSKTANPLYVPIMSLCLLPSMAVSGFLAETLSFQGLYTVSVACAMVSWVVAWFHINHQTTKQLNNEITK